MNVPMSIGVCGGSASFQNRETWAGICSTNQTPEMEKMQHRSDGLSEKRVRSTEKSAAEPGHRSCSFAGKVFFL